MRKLIQKTPKRKQKESFNFVASEILWPVLNFHSISEQILVTSFRKRTVYSLQGSYHETHCLLFGISVLQRRNQICLSTLSY